MVLSILCLVGGSLVAVSLEGVFYGVFAGLGFGGYLFFFGRALRALPLFQVIPEGDGGPDPARKRTSETGPPRPRKAYLTAA